MNKHYLMERDNGARYIESRTQSPEKFLAEVPSELAGEDAEALALETVTDGMGQEQKRVVVDEVKREAKAKEREAEKALRALDAKAGEERKARLRAIDWAKVKGDATLIAIVKDLVDKD